MEETRRLRIVRKRFSKEKLKAIFQLIEEHKKSLEDKKVDCNFKVTLDCTDDTSFTCSDSSIFEDNREADNKPPKSLVIQLSAWRIKNEICLSLVNNGGRDDSLLVSGDREWVSRAFNQIKELIDSAEPSDSWFTRHQLLTHLTIALSTISLTILLMNLSIHLLETTFTNILSPYKMEAIKTLRYSLALFPAIFTVSIADWFLGAWPPVEIDMGPPQYKRARIKKRKDKLCF